MHRFLNEEELRRVGLGHCGRDVLIDRSAILIRPECLRIGDHSRIDALALIVAGKDGVEIGGNVHIASSAQVFGNSARVVFEDFSGIAPRVTLLSATDDFLEGYLTNPTVPQQYRQATVGSIVLQRHAIVGAGSVVLPGVTIGWGAAVGALSFVRESVPDLSVMFGSPARKVATRRRDLLEQLERQYLAELAQSGLSRQSETPPPPEARERGGRNYS